MVRFSLGELVVSEDSPRYEARSFDSTVNDWYKARIKIESPEKLDEVTTWLLENIDGWHKHADWRMINGGYLDLRFRHQRDYEWFILRWY